MKLWGGRFEQATDGVVDDFNASIHFDHCLYDVDIRGSIAHVKMLKACHLLDESEASTLIVGLESVKAKIAAGELEFSIHDEDIHMNIERLLFAEIGDLAGKLHSGRSRNDQVALDMHLYLMESIDDILKRVKTLQAVFVSLAREHIDTIVPAYTHLQRAEPIRFAHHLLAYAQMLQRDLKRFEQSRQSANVSPLGAGALAGSGLPIDNALTAEFLGFDSCYQNSLDAVSDRDFLVEFLSSAALLMMHLSKLSEEIILWSSTEFGFITLDDAFATGSSMMPQKKNPDIAELTRGKTGRVYGALMSLLTVLKGLPLAYNKDLQEDKEGVFDTINTLKMTLSAFTPMVKSMTVNKSVMMAAASDDFSNATQVANFLVDKGLNFRSAHKAAGELVAECVSRGCLLKDLSLADYQSNNPLFNQEIYQWLSPEAVIEAHTVACGTARAAVEKQLDALQALMAD